MTPVKERGSPEVNRVWHRLELCQNIKSSQSVSTRGGGGEEPRKTKKKRDKEGHTTACRDPPARLGSDKRASSKGTRLYTGPVFILETPGLSSEVTTFLGRQETRSEKTHGSSIGGRTRA